MRSCYEAKLFPKLTGRRLVDKRPEELVIPSPFSLAVFPSNLGLAFPKKRLRGLLVWFASLHSTLEGNYL